MSYQLSAVVADVGCCASRPPTSITRCWPRSGRTRAAAGHPELVEELTGGLPDFAADEPCAVRPFRLVLSPPLADLLARGRGAGRWRTWRRSSRAGSATSRRWCGWAAR